MAIAVIEDIIAGAGFSYSLMDGGTVRRRFKVSGLSATPAS